MTMYKFNKKKRVYLSLMILDVGFESKKKYRYSTFIRKKFVRFACYFRALVF